MKVTCDVIKDILPLYVENMASEDTRYLVEEHIANCESCKKQLEEMSLPIKPIFDTDTEPLKKIKNTLRKKKLQTIILTVMLTAILFSTGIAFLTSPEYIPYSPDVVSFIKNDTGLVIAVFSDEVAGYDIHSYPSENGSGYTYHITTWNSIWNKKISKKSVNNTVLNPNGEEVDSVYYYTTDGNQDVLIYGTNQFQNGGVLTLPRLVLAYYLTIAILLAVISGIILIVFRHKEKVKSIMIKFFMLPVSYIMAHICIKGFTTSSYLAARDFFAILFVTILIYVVLLCLVTIKKNEKSELV